MAAQDNASATHLVIMIHGLWGNPSHLNHLKDAITEAHGGQIHLLLTESNSSSFTYDGIEVGAERVTHEVEDYIQDLEGKGVKLDKISVIGYSLGGLIARYTIGLLYSRGYFEAGKLQPINFTTFATPHLGVRTPKIGWGSSFWNMMGSHTLATSGRQLFTIDEFRDTGRPILAVLADPESIFIKALASFKNRSLYSNAVNDRTAVFYTTYISKTNPFANPDAVKPNYLTDYAPVVMVPNDPIQPVKQPDQRLIDRMMLQGRHFREQLPLIIFFSLVLPLGSIFYFINSGVQTIRSAQRVRLHEEGHGALDYVRGYRLPGLLTRESERVFEAANQARGEDVLPSSSHVDDSDSEKGFVKEQAFPTLALTPDQFAMIEALDNVGFKKYAVWIHNHLHSHAAIVVRTARAAFAEGKVISKHWTDMFEV